MPAQAERTDRGSRLPKRKPDWIADCAHKERHLLARKLASEEELRLTRPRTRSAPLEQWITHYAKLGQLLGREDQRALFLGHSEADAQVVAALLSEPAILHLTPHGAAADATEVAVYPKSFDTLVHIFHVRDWLLTVWVARYHALRQQAHPADADLLARTAGEISYQQRLLAWVACTEGLGAPANVGPWRPKADRPEIPEPFLSLDAGDLLRIHEAYLRVNAAQLQALDRIVEPGNASGQRPAWSIFFGKLALRMKVAPERLMKDYALAALLATVKLAAPEGGDDVAEDLEEAG